MSVVTIKSGNHQKVLSLLEKTVSLISPSGRGLEGRNIIYFDQHLLIIDSLVSIHGCDEFDPNKMRIVRAAIFRFSKYRIRTIHYFKRAIEAEVRVIRKGRKYRFYMVFPTLIDPTSLTQIQRFTLFKNSIEVKNLCQIRQEFEIDRAIQEASPDLSAKIRTFLTGRLNNITYLTLARTASSSDQAFGSAHKVMGLLRGIITFSLTRYTYHFQGGMPRPLAFVPPSPCYFVFGHNGAFKDYWWVSPPLTFPTIKRLNPRQVQEIARFVDLFNHGLEVGNLAWKVLEPMLLLYGLALDQVDRDLTFLHLWQILEFVALGHIDQRPDIEKKKRIKALLRSDVPKGVFECLYKRRNLLVHKGRFDVRLEDEINALKSLCDYSISFLFEHIDKLNDWRALRAYLENVKLDKAEIDLKIQVLREITAD